MSTFSARILLSASSASSTSVSWSRPWASVRKASVRSRRPLDRHARALRGPEADDLFGVDVDLGAEAAADIGRDDPQLVLGRDVVERAHHQPRDMRVLRRRPAGVVVLGRVVVAERGARLHRVRHQAVVVDVDLGDVRGLGEGLVGRGLVADLPVEDQVAGCLGMKLRRAFLQGVGRMDDRRQLLIGDFDGLGGVARLGLGLGDDHRERLADIAHDVGGERRIGAHLHRRAVLGGDRPAADQVADAVALQLLAVQDRDDARHALRRAGVEPGDPGMRVRRAHEGRILHAGDAHIVHIAAAAGDEPPVFLAQNLCADAFNTHSRNLPVFGSGGAPAVRPASVPPFGDAAAGLFGRDLLRARGARRRQESP